MTSALVTVALVTAAVGSLGVAVISVGKEMARLALVQRD